MHVYLVPPPSWIPEDVDHGTPATETGVEVIVAILCVVVVLQMRQWGGVLMELLHCT